MPTPIPAVAYYRMSDAQQELSIEQQIPLVREMAEKNGYKIIREYSDAGKSGSKNREKRVSFDRLINDAVERRDVVAVLCYDTSRFTRQDSQAAAADKMTLRGAGCHILDTCCDGCIDWNTTEGRMMDAFRAEGNNAAAVKISQQTTRGRVYFCKQGFWPVGGVPYGFDRLYTDGTHTISIARTDRTFKKGRNWHLKLVENASEIAIVKEIFTRVFAEGISFRALAAELTARRIPSPDPNRGKAVGWTKDTIKAIINQKAYIGIAHIGNGRRGNREILNKVDATEVEGACPAPIDRKLWDEVHLALGKRRAEGRKPQFHKSAVLSGFIVCGHCGYRMEKKNLRGKTTFTCGSANKRPTLGCRQWRVYEDKLLPDAMAWLAEELDFEILRAMQAKPKGKQTTQETHLAAQIAKLKKKGHQRHGIGA
jgi:DNA invertase Pin-like site-specific DNA recombinase